MSKEGSIKVICWGLKYARTCFHAELGDDRLSQKAKQMKTPVEANAGVGDRRVCLLWYHPGLGNSATNPEMASGLPGNQSPQAAW